MRYIGLLGARIVDAAHYVTGVAILFYLGLKSVFAQDRHDSDGLARPAGGISEAACRSVPEAIVLGGLLGFAAVAAADRYPKDISGLAFVAVVMRELVPLVAAFLLVARTAPLIAIRLATGMVDEELGPDAQIDLGRIRHEVPPRMALCVLAALMLTTVCLVSAIAGGALASRNVISFADKVVRTLKPLDFPYLLLKPTVYGIIVCVVSCHRGFATTRRDEIPYAAGSAFLGSLVLCVAATCLGDGIFYALA